MACSSDGDKIETRTRTKTRHFSSGSMSSEEINSIIGIDVNAKKEQIRTYLDKQNSTQPNKNKQGNSVNKVNDDTPIKNIQDQPKVLDEHVEDAFKPKKVVKRTPTRENATKQQPEPNNGKRNRSELSPDVQSHKKRHFSENQEKDTQIMDLNEDIILEMFDNLDIINNVTNTSNLLQSEQNSLREAHNNLHKLITRLVFRYTTLEKANKILKNKVQNNGVFEKPGQHMQKTTYLDVAKKALQTNDTTEETEMHLTTKENLQWKTPPIVKRHETVIQIKNTNNPNDAIKQLKSELRNCDVGKGFKNIQTTKNGTIIVESLDKKQQEKLKTALKDNKNIKMKESGDVNPMFMITGINKGFHVRFRCRIFRRTTKSKL